MKNKLDNVHSFKLYKWMEIKHGSFNDSRITIHQAAKLATEELGFTVTFNNIKRVCEQLELKINWRIERVQRKTNPKTRIRLDMLRAAVINLYTSLGEPVPDALQVDWD